MKSITSQSRDKGLAFPIILIMAGLTFLLERNGLIDHQTMFQLLPLVPVFIGTLLLVLRLRRKAGRSRT